MKKIAILLVLFAFVAGVVFSTAQKEKMTDANEISLLNNADAASPEGKVWKTVLDAFLAANPGITIKEEALYGEAYHQKAKARAAGNDLPDVMYLWPGARSSYMYDNNLIEDLTPYIDKSKFKASAMGAQGPNGEIFELPWTITACSIMYVNTKLLKDNGMSIPKTYEELAAMVKPLKSKGMDTIIMSNDSGWVMNSCLFGTFVGRYGGPDWMAKAAAGQHKFTDDAFVNALKMVDKIYKDGVLPKSSLQTSYGDGPTLFVNGKAPFFIDGIWRASAFNEAPEEFRNNIKLIVFPAIPGEKFPQCSSIVPGIGFGMVKGLEGKKKENALKLIKWVAGYDASKIRLAEQGFVPVYEGDYENPTDVIMKKVFAFYTDYPKGCGVVDNFIGGNTNETLNTGMQEIGLGTKTPEQVAQEVEAAR
ncbi:MAG: extracellular solute-binding protein [Spirochaetales bacterium]|nr:extracellular solute-binding protein [Spirochaetales bacterium]